MNATEVAPEVLAELLAAVGAKCETLWLEEAGDSQLLTQEIVSSAIEELVRRSAKLRVLVLRASAPLPLVLVKAIAGREQLKVLHLKGIPGDAVSALLSMPNLTTLGLHDCGNLTDAVLKAQPASGLKSMYLTDAGQLSDAALARFLLRCRDLQSIDIRGATLAGNETMAALRQLPALATAVAYNTGITIEAIKKLHGERPWMELEHR